MIVPPPFFARTGAKARACAAARQSSLHFIQLSRCLNRPIGEKAAGPCDASIVDEQVDVPGRARRADGVFVAGDIQFSATTPFR